MTINIQVPSLGESVTEATVAKWFKQVGETVARDEPLVELETDKVTLEVNAAAAGTLTEIVAETGATVAVGALLGTIAEGAAGAAKPAAKPAAAAPAPAKAVAPAAAPKPAPAPAPAPAKPAAPAFPAAAKLAAEKGVEAAALAGTGKGGRITKGDVLAFLEQPPAGPAEPAPAARPAAARSEAAREERVRMSKLRRVIAARLKEAQNTAAMLTTFNEVDMTALLAARKAYADAFERKHGIRLGFMAFFVKACIVALKEFPAVNAEIEGEDIVYKNYYHMGVAVSTPQGLIVPVLKDADQLGFAAVEAGIADFGKRAREGKLGLDELQGGTFTISNGGVFGSLLSTPILNPPQSGILGMHKVQQRPVAVGDEIRIRPMMYLALSYDHRIVDGREAVSFLVRVKECIEDPQRILFDV